ncbi:uncharacterized protein HD556DRAFT_1449928 [Suillus plorans]|uniref:Uncharacterized protein n=1 Tax=Suillus plorans TaxID=116603 RepID=A0A9P7AC23_9AGAM|nr:uncharacterized protein HD556DRAFT_1449928 [Suillus plorans]KAG1786192.1 hypothetical protein HD556DRAFT_1449928 [Suillus plorans]
MPSTEVSNKALDDAAARVQELVAQAVEWKDGHSGHLRMAMDLAKILSPVFEQHGRSASMIPPLLLSAAMELHHHVDPTTCQSFLSPPKALTFIGTSNPSVSSHPPMQTATHMIANAPAEPLVAPKSKPKAKAKRKKTLTVVDSSDSDGIEIIEHVVATNDIGPDNRRGKGTQTALPEDVDGDTPVEIVQANTVTGRQRPMPRRKQTQPTGSHDTKSVVMDRKGKGKEVPPPVDIMDGDGIAPLKSKRSRESSWNEQLTGRTPSATRPPVSAYTGDQRKPWFEQPHPLPATVDRKLNIGKQHKSSHRRTPSMECTEDPSPEATADVANELVVPTKSINMNMASSQNAVPRRLSLPPITAVSAGSPPLLESSPAVMHPSIPPPRHMQLPPSHTQHMDIDVPADTVVKDLQAMTLEVGQDSASVLKGHEEMYNTIHDLRNQVVELRARNAAAAESLEVLNIRVAAQDVEMRSIETLHADVAVLQEQVRALHEESRTHENQLRAADVKLASQGSTTAVLQDAYEALRQCLIPTPSIPPHYNNAVFFPPSHQHQHPYNQGLSVGQAQAMERMYFNFTPGPSTAAGPSAGTLSAGVSLPGTMHALSGPSTVAGPSLTSGMHAPSGPSGSHVTRSSQSTGNLGESASAFRRN